MFFRKKTKKEVIHICSYCGDVIKDKYEIEEEKENSIKICKKCFLKITSGRDKS